METFYEPDGRDAITGMRTRSGRSKLLLPGWFSCAALFALITAAAQSSEPAAPPPQGVILLHGLCRTSLSMRKMENALKDSGFIVLNVDYASRSETIEQLADSVIERAMSDKSLESCVRVHFVTHSLGGILVRSYFSRHSGDRIGRVVMLGPPNRGSDVVDRIGEWRLFKMIHGPAGGELGTSDQAVPNMLGPVGFELGVIAGNRTINWINSIMIEGADDGKVSIERTKVTGMKEHVTVSCSHPFLMKDEEAIEHTIRFLSTGSFAVPDDGDTLPGTDD